MTYEATLKNSNTGKIIARNVNSDPFQAISGIKVPGDFELTLTDTDDGSVVCKSSGDNFKAAYLTMINQLKIKFDPITVHLSPVHIRRRR